MSRRVHGVTADDSGRVRAAALSPVDTARREYLAGEFLALGIAEGARVKVMSSEGQTKWLSVSAGTVWAIARAVLDSEPVA